MQNSMMKNKISEIIRVNHAGEYGAKRIYSGQIAASKNSKNNKLTDILHHMKQQEEEHFEYFDQKITKYRIRPTLMQPVWNIAGFAMGYITAKMGEKTAMTCTVAVEEVIDQHYEEQLKYLKKDPQNNKELIDKIEQFQKEELEHRDIALDNNAQSSKIYEPLKFFISNASKLAIKISKKI
jgi:ubiquinone biosynthesis monooxygenase Coq7